MVYAERTRLEDKPLPPHLQAESIPGTSVTETLELSSVLEPEEEEGLICITPDFHG